MKRRSSFGAFLQPAGMAVACVFLVTALTFATAGCGPPPPPTDSGVQGEVRIAPVNPVEQPGVPNDAPYVATLRIKRISDGEVLVETTSAADGTFRVALAPGRYVLEPVNGEPLPVASSQEFTVNAGSFTTIRVDYDSGIR